MEGRRYQFVVRTAAEDSRVKAVVVEVWRDDQFRQLERRLPTTTVTALGLELYDFGWGPKTLSF